MSLRITVSSGRLHGGGCPLIRDSLILEGLIAQLIAIHREQLLPGGESTERGEHLKDSAKKVRCLVKAGVWLRVAYGDASTLGPCLTRG